MRYSVIVLRVRGVAEDAGEKGGPFFRWIHSPGGILNLP